MANWDDYRYFSILAQTGTVRAGAEVLEVNPSTVTRRLDALESRLGLTLFVRSRTGLTLTTDGEELLEELKPLADQLGGLEQELADRGREVAGMVRITMADVFAIALMSELAGYTLAHPGVRLELLPGYQPLDLARGEADVAIRVTEQPPEDLVGRMLGRYRVGVYGSHSYLAGHDPLAEPEGSLWIESGVESARAGAFRAQHFARVPLGARCNSVLLQHAAVASDMGICMLPCVIGDPDERLCRVGGFDPVDAQDIWLLFHPDLRGVARIQSVCSYIQEAFERLQPSLTGQQKNRRTRS